MATRSRARAPVLETIIEDNDRQYNDCAPLDASQESGFSPEDASASLFTEAHDR